MLAEKVFCAVLDFGFLGRSLKNVSAPSECTVALVWLSLHKSFSSDLQKLLKSRLKSVGMRDGGEVTGLGPGVEPTGPPWRARAAVACLRTVVPWRACTPLGFGCYSIQSPDLVLI